MMTRGPTWALLGAMALGAPSATDARTSGAGACGRGAAAERLETTIQFSFEVRDVVTNHQFDGQTNSFFVRYEYIAPLAAAPFDPNGHQVSASSFPYFQTVRDDMLSYVRAYPDRTDFYEIFASSIAHHLMEGYPQLRWIELGVRAPAFAGVTTDRTVTVRIRRGGGPQPRHVLLIVDRA